MLSLIATIRALEKLLPLTKEPLVEFPLPFASFRVIGSRRSNFVSGLVASKRTSKKKSLTDDDGVVGNETVTPVDPVTFTRSPSIRLCGASVVTTIFDPLVKILLIAIFADPLALIRIPTSKPSVMKLPALSSIKSLCARPVASGSPSWKLIVLAVMLGSSSLSRFSFSSTTA